MQSQFHVFGMSCDACANTVTRLLSQVSGVISVDVDLLTSTATLFSNHPISEDELNHALSATGVYSVAPLSDPY